jgi:hypothetical protein
MLNTATTAMQDTQPVATVKPAPKLSLVEAATTRYESAHATTQHQTGAEAFRQRAQERLQLLQNSGLDATPAAATLPAAARPAPRAHRTPIAGPLAARHTLPLHFAWGAVCALLCAALVWQSFRLWSANSAPLRATTATPATPVANGGVATGAPSDAVPQLRLSTELSQPAAQP